jgi:hypothetical protein
MDKFLLVLFFLIKIIVVIIAPILLIIFKRYEIKKYLIGIELFALIVIIVLYVIGFSYMTDSNIINILNIKLLGDSDKSIISDLYENISTSNSIKTLEAVKDYKTHRNSNVYYYDGLNMPLSAKKIKCESGYDYYKYYSDIITSTSMLLSTYFDKTISPLEVLDKTINAGLIKCGEPINQDSFFYMIYNEYHVDFKVINNSELRNYILNGKPVLLETNGNGNLSCNQSYFLIYDVNNNDDYLLLDPNNKSYNYICPDGSTGFGSMLKPNYNDSSFSYSDILSDTRRLIVIAGSR